MVKTKKKETTIEQRCAAVTLSHIAGEISAKDYARYIKAAETGKIPLKLSEAEFGEWLKEAQGKGMRSGAILCALSPEQYWARWVNKSKRPAMRIYQEAAPYYGIPDARAGWEDAWEPVAVLEQVARAGVFSIVMTRRSRV